ncbi:hypothetical protein CFOL_v3_22150 [Cephalotus follicularis]|uniref:SH2 domain-containing protein n=1 Tax=Cephalotus follicularis TaxID=3775 RepID=A0A1Q3CEQ1_CEPFO|nr:hypothetical protein CFOL_v3_22150 [Cephalotus follicularis]
MGDKNVIKSEDYCMLKDFKEEIEGEEGTCLLCFWVYLLKSTTFPATILRQQVEYVGQLMPGVQVHLGISDSAPFLVLNEKKIMVLFPLTHIHKETPDPGNYASWTEIQHASMETEFPLEKWVHVTCEVSNKFLRLHIGGEIVGEQPLSFTLNKNSKLNGSGKIALINMGGDHDGVQGYIHNVKILPLSFSVKDHYLKNPPIHLSIDNSSTYEIEVENDGSWSIVGGKASCCRIFSLDVVLLNAIGQPVNKETEVVASLLYSDNGAPVEKTSDEEAPLLTICDGVEFSSSDRPIKLLHGRASFKLKISQLSSRCENRMFCIRFEIPKIGAYLFLKAFSPPIHSISRNRNVRPSTIIWRRPSSAIHSLNGSQSPGKDNGSSRLQHSTVCEAKANLSSKRVRLGEESISSKEQHDEECNSHPLTAKQVNNAFGTSMVSRPQNVEESDNSSSDSENTEGRDSASRSMSSSRNSVSDLSIFSYCLGGLAERSLLLKEIATSASDQQLLEFAQQVSLYSGCSHHRHQVKLAKKLIEEGTKAWNMISQNKNHVRWERVVVEIEEQFMRIACCNTRSLKQQDFELLRRVSGCQEYVAQENFEKLWCWLYPVGFTLSRDWVNAMWASTSPKWIEGFITKEEAELSLQGPRGLQEPGTFILRFPTSRSWPHPDAGSLIVTYVGSDYALHHRLLSLDYVCSYGRDTNVKSLQNMLLSEPELSRLGRIIRRH